MTNPTPHGQVPEALRLAALLDADEWPGSMSLVSYARACVAELLRLHAENQVLRTTHVQSPTENEHVAGDVWKNGVKLNMSTQQKAAEASRFGSPELQAMIVARCVAKDQADSVREDAARYRMVRRGQRWSVVDGIGNDLRAEALDSAIDAIRVSHVQAPAQPVGPCAICGSDEPFTDTCGSGDPRALCKQPSTSPQAAQQAPAKLVEAVTKAILFEDTGSSEGWEENTNLGEAAIRVCDARNPPRCSYCHSATGAPLAAPAPVGVQPVAWAATSEDGDVEALGMNQSRRFDTPLYTHPSPPEGIAGWVSVDERLPEPNVEVLCAGRGWGNSFVTACYYDDERREWYPINTHWTDATGCAQYPTHWMPLPPSPSMDGESNGAQ